MQTQLRAATCEAELLDNVYLNSLLNALGIKITRDVLADGLIEVSDRLEHLADRAASGDKQQVSRTAHDIAGSAGHLGMHALCVAARKLEQDLNSASDEKLGELASNFLALGPRSLSALRTHIDHLD